MLQRDRFRLMFGIDGIEFLIILIVMIVVVGPKDLPKMLRAFGQATNKMRRTAMEFRAHFDEAMREAELNELSDTLQEMKKLDPRKNLTEIFDPIRDVASDIKTGLENKPPMTTQAPAAKKTDDKISTQYEQKTTKKQLSKGRKNIKSAIKIDLDEKALEEKQHVAKKGGVVKSKKTAAGKNPKMEAS